MLETIIRGYRRMELAARMTDIAAAAGIVTVLQEVSGPAFISVEQPVVVPTPDSIEN
jgi:hypothetical protein